MFYLGFNLKNNVRWYIKLLCDLIVIDFLNKSFELHVSYLSLLQLILKYVFKTLK